MVANLSSRDRSDSLPFFRAEMCAIEAVEPEVGKWETGSVRFTFGSLTRWLAGSVAARESTSNAMIAREGGKDRQKHGSFCLC